MPALQLGRRYERLLFLSGPLSLLAMLILFVAFTSTTQKERTLANCFEVAVSTINKNEVKLNESWNQYQKVKKSKFHTNNYSYDLSMIWISPGIESGCHKEMEVYFNQGDDTAPEILVEQFKKRADQLKNTPFEFKGFEISQVATTNILGTNIKIKLSTLTFLLQISLAPIIMIWLGSLYNTRYRETLLVGKASNISDVFPHLINIYPSGDLPSIRRRNMLVYWLPPKTLACVIYTAVRISLVSIIIGPVIGSYLYSLFLLPTEGLEWLFIVFGIIVSIFSLTVLTAEILPWHSLKFFPGSSNAH